MSYRFTVPTVLVLLAAGVTAQSTRPADKATSRPSAAKTDAPKTLALGHSVDASLKLPDLDGNQHSMADFKGRITVVNFWSARCPVQKGWDPTLSKLVNQYGDRVTFLMVNSNEANGELQGKGADDKPYGELRKALTERDLPYKVLIDRHSVVADAFGARTTPDIFVFGKDARLIYRGLIDNDPRGTKGDKTEHHLRDTLEGLIAGKKLKPRETKPHGCSIKRAKKDGKGDKKRVRRATSRRSDR